MRRVLTAAIAVTALLLGGGCGGDSGGDDRPAPGASGAAFPATAGGVTLERRPERIVSLAPTATEMLFAIGAGSQVVAVDDQSTFPAEAPRTDLSGFKPNAEAIAAKNPDLVVLSDDLNKIVDQLTKLKVPVLLARAAGTLDDTYAQIGQLGTLTGHPAEAAALNERMRTQIDKIVGGVPARSAPLTYYYELDPTFYTVTSQTFVGSIFARFGLTNIADGAKTAYPQLSPEKLIAADPDMVFLADSKCCAQSPETVKARKGWAGVTAVKNNQIVALDDDIASRWGPRVVDLVQAVADAVAKARA
ncbi:ABC transporter substrate-binding protein [Actinoplanes sp. NBRC 14428]|uniref:Iron complex transport system substrate-binding protein n=1 Tax=Pseudosporangium ferrugineum TaxID=439699 RepID=A0A2T0S7J4_9ACTN|nr:ABC transporter substrate-binding protein [Pseudosporangium ferrugineum]PRY29365.1 iron complex transport system substrate-binding protein [Pseudosporangium ferrugineum]BCJ52914.1 ABC transporter substrate-binding protein [Actinoplanes sp. NBRC 14428]